MRKALALVLSSAFAYSLTASARAESYDPTPLTAKQIFEKAEAAAGKREPGTYKEVERVSGNGVVRMRTSYYDAGGNSKHLLEGGGFTDAWGEFNKQSWEQDENGVVTLQSDFHEKEDPNALALAHPEDPKYRVRVLGLTQSDPREYVVELNPPGGRDTYRYYNAQTFLLDRVVTYARDRFRHVTEYLDYRTMFGETFPYRVHSFDGRPQNDLVEQDLSFDRIGGAVDFNIPVSRSLFRLPGTAPVTLPAKITRDGIVLRAQVNGRGLDFVLDSGASGMFIDPGIAHQLGLEPYSRSTETIGGGDVDSGLVRIASMSIGPLVLDQPVFATTPYTHQVDESRVVGLLGYDFISSGVLEVDFKAGAVRVYPREAFNPATLGLIALPADLDDGIPRVRASIEHVPGHFLLDTGAFASMAFEDYLQKLPSAVMETQMQIGTVGGAMNATVRDVTDLQFANVLFRSAQIIVPSGSTFDIADYDGGIGRDVLSMCRVFFDYGQRTIYAHCGA